MIYLDLAQSTQCPSHTSSRAQTGKYLTALAQQVSHEMVDITHFPVIYLIIYTIFTIDLALHKESLPNLQIFSLVQKNLLAVTAFFVASFTQHLPRHSSLKRLGSL